MDNAAVDVHRLTAYEADQLSRASTALQLAPCRNTQHSIAQGFPGAASSTQMKPQSTSEQSHITNSIIISLGCTSSAWGDY